jgi:protein O-GlcNAc transferase
LARAALGLPDGAFVFCCFCTRAKITPDAFESWMRIVSGTAGSVLWLADPGEAAAANLRSEAQRRGVAPERLHFAPRVATMAAHLARLGAADLFLDTFHYNGHVTTSDALYAGLPVVTVVGDSYASRVSASLLRAVGLGELAKAGPREFEALALQLAREREALRAIQERLAAARATSPAFDVPRLARALESLYARMVERHREGLAPAPLLP